MSHYILYRNHLHMSFRKSYHIHSLRFLCNDRHKPMHMHLCNLDNKPRHMYFHNYEYMHLCNLAARSCLPT